MTYHNNPTPPPAPRRNGYGVMAILGLLGLLVLGGLVLSMMGDDNVARNERPATTTSTTGSGPLAPAPKRETTGQPMPQRPATAPTPAPKQ
jgi:hypothetical protein